MSSWIREEDVTTPSWIRESGIILPWAAEVSLGAIATSGIAQTGSANTLMLETNAPMTLPNNAILQLSSGAGSVQEREIVAYDGGTKVATVSPRWRVNLQPQSEQLDDLTAWPLRINITVIADAIPNSAGNFAEKIEEDATNNVHQLRADAIATVPGAMLSCSVDAKAGERTWCRLRVDFGGNIYGCYVDLTSGTPGSLGVTVGATVQIEHVGDEWYRISIIGPAGSGSTSFMLIQIATGDEGNVYSGTPGQGVYLSRGQIEPANDPGDYIKTEASAITLPDNTTGYKITAVGNAWN